MRGGTKGIARHVFSSLTHRHYVTRFTSPSQGRPRNPARVNWRRRDVILYEAVRDWRPHSHEAHASAGGAFQYREKPLDAVSRNCRRLIPSLGEDRRELDRLA